MDPPADRPTSPRHCRGLLDPLLGGYWADRNRRWHRYDHLDPTPQLDDLLKEINQDPLSMFWG
ncbi:MAG: DUF3024 domain-containing protein [Actinomycetes bacterium]